MADDVERRHDDEKAQQADDRRCWRSFILTATVSLCVMTMAMYEYWESPVGTAIRVNSAQYFILCLIGGTLSGLPHTLLTPVDLIKCRVQCGEYTSFSEGWRSILAEGRGSWCVSVPLFYRGWAPTFIGYSCQGALKFMLYEAFKVLIGSLVRESLRYSVVVFLASSMMAELVADIALAPWEAVKVKIQTTRTFVPILSITVPRIWRSEGMNGFFKGIVPLWARQVPYTMVKFATFEKVAAVVYGALGWTRYNTAPHQQLTVSILAGLTSGALCAVVSHPADTIVSKLNQRTDGRTTALDVLRTLTCAELWRGLVVRIGMIGILTAMQWLIYDSFKVAVGLPATGASK